ncbi:hypothetical protein [Lentzea sp. CC55]|uniref:hypothetical protein n=1 Tax=Lentzea sp. CC55 TaxID=2884909 RepID=UPI0027E07FAB|nr:hypothetical protein [Lentzea sp. CC55]MCG8924492.1 hypothetical protein [Lentzea sp. CC55]
MSLHAFVDESRRNNTYLLAAVLVEPGDLTRTRKALRRLLFPGQRELHFKKEKVDRRKLIVSKLVAIGAAVHLYSCDCSAGEEIARQECLIALIDDLVDLDTRRLVLDSREERNLHDSQTIRAALGKRPSHSKMIYEHLNSTQDELLWIPDVVAWCHGAGGDWARRVRSLVAKEVAVDKWSG